MYKFTRAMYKKIKKYDREDMNNFIESVYLKGFNDGNNRPEIDKLYIEEKLKGVKGIGEKTREKVIQSIFG